MKLSSIWSFWYEGSASGGVPLSKQVQRRLAVDYALSEARAASLCMVTQMGNFAGRKVTYFRVFDPDAVKAAGVDLHQFDDLNGHPQLRLFQGNIESDGEVILTRPEIHPNGSLR